MVEQRPFKALVVGSSPTQPTFDFSTLTSQGKQLIKPLGERSRLSEKRVKQVFANSAFVAKNRRQRFPFSDNLAGIQIR